MPLIPFHFIYIYIYIHHAIHIFGTENTKIIINFITKQKHVNDNKSVYKINVIKVIICLVSLIM